VTPSGHSIKSFVHPVGSLGDIALLLLLLLPLLLLPVVLLLLLPVVLLLLLTVLLLLLLLVLLLSGRTTDTGDVDDDALHGLNSQLLKASRPTNVTPSGHSFKSFVHPFG
jgi:hypothetical protein